MTFVNEFDLELVIMNWDGSSKFTREFSIAQIDIKCMRSMQIFFSPPTPLESKVMGDKTFLEFHA